MIRKSLNAGESFMLDNKEYQISSIKGDGANCIVYEAHYEDKLGLKHKVNIKENYPFSAEIIRKGKKLIWKSEDEREQCRELFISSYRRLMEFQNNNYAVKTFGLFDCNNTQYIVMDYNDGVTFDKDDASLKDILKTIRLLTYVVGEYHKNGFLHLDIKPDNFLVYPRPSEHIVLFDFDTVIAISDIKKGKVKAISYSDGWAAPEQKQGLFDMLCPATDIFSIGAVLFEKVMGRKVDISDISIFSQWDFKEEKIKNINPKIKRLLSNIFRNTLNANIARRYQSTSELIKDLDLAIKTCDEIMYVVSNVPILTSDFIGREHELKEISDSFLSGYKAVFLSGNGGIGKSSLAIKYARENRNNYDAILFYRYNNSLENFFNEIDIQNLSIEENNRKKSILTGILNSGKYLVIVDNFDVAVDKESVEDILQINANIIFTTRTNFGDYSGEIKQIEVGSLSESELEILFRNVSRKNLIQENDKKYLKRLFKLVGYHTYATELLAAQIVASDYTIEDLYEKVRTGLSSLSNSEKIKAKKDGRIVRDRMPEIISAIYNISNLSEEKKQVLRNVYLLNFLNITKDIYKEYTRCNASDFDELNELVELRYVMKNGNIYSLHPLIDELVKNELEPNEDNCPRIYCLIYHKMQVDEVLDQSPFSYKTDLTLFGSLDEYIIDKNNEFICSFFNHVDLQLECNISFLIEWLYTFLEDEYDEEKELGIGSPISSCFAGIYNKLEMLRNEKSMSLQRIFDIDYILFCAWLFEFSKIFISVDDEVVKRYKLREKNILKYYDKVLDSANNLCGDNKKCAIDKIECIIAYFYNNNLIGSFNLPDGFFNDTKNKRPELFEDFVFESPNSETENEIDDDEKFYEKDFENTSDKVGFIKNLLSDESLSPFERMGNADSCFDYSYSYLMNYQNRRIEMQDIDWQQLKETVSLMNSFLWQDENEPEVEHESEDWEYYKETYDLWELIIDVYMNDPKYGDDRINEYFDFIFEKIRIVSIDTYILYDWRHKITVRELSTALINIGKGYLMTKPFIRYIEFWENYSKKNNVDISNFIFSNYEDFCSFLYYFASKETDIPEEYKFDYAELEKIYRQKMKRIANIEFTLREESSEE
ncbi:MAG: hypothetical protein MSH11_09390 [Ruminococcus sp.]|nr:hypothetical protein [Ruminococcus sp.]